MTKEILTSLHGLEIGLDADRDLIVGGKQISDKAAEVGAKNGTAVVETSLIDGVFRKVKLTCTALAIPLTDESGVCVHGGYKVYDFPAGLLCFMGASVVGELTGDDVNATFDGDVALGSTEVDNTATPMVTTQQDLLANTTLAAATAKVAPVDAFTVPGLLTESGAVWLDGRSTAKDMWLNFLIDEDGANATADGAFTGTIEFIYAIIGNVDPA